MPLPMSKSALDRLGERLASGPITESDLESLALAVDAYQQVLDDVKDQLGQLQYQATTRVKTTGTLVEKLRRERPMRLSQVQDLAGARTIVADRLTQDEALAKIRSHFEASGRVCKEVDRRKAPSHGYRALHLIVQVGPIPVEIQIRTELEDTWAQIVERLADRWGRGIRYGEDPESSEATVTAGGQVISRKAAIEYLAELSSAIDSFELIRAISVLEAQTMETFGRLMAYADQLEQAQDQRLVSELPDDERAMADLMAASLAAIPVPEVQEAVTSPPNMTMAQMFGLQRRLLELMREENDVMLQQLHGRERELRDTLQLIAAAMDEGE